jgi:glycosyltransferase involved in cell wall biosynthesis
MYGWEFPPNNVGGLGTACHGLTKGLVEKGVDVVFVLPSGEDIEGSHVRVVIADKRAGSIKIKKIDSSLAAYMTSVEYSYILKKIGKNGSVYGTSLFAEVERYAKNSLNAVKGENFDIIHCHDWMTYLAGIDAKKFSGKPLVVHIHATEFDRTGGNGVNQAVYDIEKKGFEEADRICAVSNFTKQKVVENYGIDPGKVEVVHNAVEFNKDSFNKSFTGFKLKESDKIVLFLGRITLQKGPDYFLYAAKKVLEMEPNVKFIIAGTGDMEPFIIEKAAELGIAKNVLFTGFLKGEDIDKAYQMADLYVMPSVSEPFGITPLEAMRNNTPVLISKQSGVSEVINHCLKVDFWDINEMANKMLSVLNYDALQKSLIDNAIEEVKQFNWKNPAKKCLDIYNDVLKYKDGEMK